MSGSKSQMRGYIFVTNGPRVLQLSSVPGHHTGGEANERHTTLQTAACRFLMSSLLRCHYIYTVGMSGD
jgi:hypothetical protein